MNHDLTTVINGEIVEQDDRPEDAALTTIEQFSQLSAVSPEVALSRPLGDIVKATLDAACKSANTRRAYEMAIGLFVQFLEDSLTARQYQALDEAGWLPLAEQVKEGRRHNWQWQGQARVLRAVTPALLDGFAVWREGQGDSRSTVAQRIPIVRTFLSVAFRENVLTPDQAHILGIKPYQSRHSRSEQPVGRRLTRVEVRKLRGAIAGKDDGEIPNKAVRDRAIVDLMLFAGLRRSEVADLHMGSFAQDGGRWWLIFSGKGDKPRRVPIHPQLYKSLIAWFERAGLTWHEHNTPVFYSVNKGDELLTPKGERSPLPSTAIGRLVAEYGHVAELAPRNGKGRLGSHDLRRTFARNAYDNGAALPKIQLILGHVDVKTTMKYIGAEVDDTDTAVDYVKY
ncbi:MAG: site-specific integrase [Anaerolineales bacterium]|nr:site-specific integrase [Anaerolineales bacterium]